MPFLFSIICDLSVKDNCFLLNIQAKDFCYADVPFWGRLTEAGAEIKQPAVKNSLLLYVKD